MRKVVAVCGSDGDDETLSDYALETAENVGRLIARNNGVLVCGGRGGIMKAACKGCKEENGITIGILPDSKNEANEFVDIVIPVPFSQARNIVVVLAGDICIAIGGKAGTLSEMCFAWIYEKPIIALSNIEGWSSKFASQKIDNRREDVIHEAKSPEEVIKKLSCEIREL